MLSLKPSDGKMTRGGNELAYLKHYSIYIAEKQTEEKERQVVDTVLAKRSTQAGLSSS